MAKHSEFVERAGTLDVIPLTQGVSLPTSNGEENIRNQDRVMPTRLLRGVIAFLVIVGCLAVFVPLAPSFPRSDLDGSWMFGLNAAVEKGLVFGRDIIFTFGPYASASTRQYHPATDIRMIWSSGLLAIAFARRPYDPGARPS